MSAHESEAVCQHCGKSHSEPRGFDLSQVLSRGDTEVKIDTAYLKCLFDRLNKSYEDNKKLKRKLNRASYDLDMEREFGGL